MNEICSDFSISVGGEIIKTHKYILAAQSDYFKLLFEQKDFIEEKENILTIEGFEYHIVKKLVMFCYTNHLESLCNNFSEILRCAHAYDFDQALYECGYHIEKYFHPKCIELLVPLMPCLALDWIYWRLLRAIDLYNVPSHVDEYEVYKSQVLNRHDDDYVFKSPCYCIDSWCQRDSFNRLHLADSLYLCMNNSNLSQETLETMISTIDCCKKYEGLWTSLNEGRMNFSPYTLNYENFLVANSKRTGYTRVSELTQDVHLLSPGTKYTDFIIAIGDKSIKTHKIVLITKSGYFANLLKDTSQECNSLSIDDCRFDIIENLVKMCYTNELKIDDENFEEILLCAHKFKFWKGLLKCVQHVWSRLEIKYFNLIIKLLPCPILEGYYYRYIRHLGYYPEKLRKDIGIANLTFEILRDVVRCSKPENLREISYSIIDWFKVDSTGRYKQFLSLVHETDRSLQDFNALIKKT